MQKPGTNLLLQLLPQSSWDRLLSLTTPFVLVKDFVLYEASASPIYAHFLTFGLAKLVIPMRDGEGVQCGLIGCEGVPEGPHLQGPGTIPVRCLIQAPATALRMRFARLQQLFDEDAALRGLILQFNQGQASISCLVASCNALHGVEQRLSRLLLMTAERTSAPVFPVTQECLSRMIGARRSTISVAAASMQHDGLIEYARGYMKILDQPGLEKTACECYGQTRRIFKGLYASAA